MANSVLEQLRELDKQREQLLSGAKTEALRKAQKAVADLNELGFNYQLVEGKAAGGRKGTRTIKEAPCPVCKFKTEPLHDARRHRSQGDKKKPFTHEELEALGFRRVGAA